MLSNALVCSRMLSYTSGRNQKKIHNIFQNLLCNMMLCIYNGNIEKRGAKMQRLEGLMRKAIQQYDLIQPGDKICIGVSGGKDSVALTIGLARLQKYFEKPFTILAVTLDPRFGDKDTDYSIMEKLMKDNNIPYIIKRTDIGSIVFDIRKESNPCSLCAKMRRGALHDIAVDNGCNKVALGHHLDDAIETFYMNLFNEGRLGCFSPKTYLSRKDITMIRPMALATEQEVRDAINHENLPIVKSVCPADGVTTRQNFKEFVSQKVHDDKAFRQKMLGALQKANLSDWGPNQTNI